MSTFISPVYNLSGITNNLCQYNTIELSEYDNIVNDSSYIYSGLTLIINYTGFTSHFDTVEHIYSNIILNNDVYTYTGITNEIHYFEIIDFYLDAVHSIDPLLGPLTEQEVIDGFSTNIMHCANKLDGLTGTCCPTQQILSNLPVVMITNEGGGGDNCDDYIARRTTEGWTLDFVFNKNGDTEWTESVFWFTGVRDEYELENYADNGLSFKFTSGGTIQWSAYRFSGYCDTISGYTEMFYIETGGTSNALCSGGTSTDFNIIVTFERNNVYTEECDLANQGGWNDLIWTGTTETLTKKWTDERSKRLGTLKIYHNGKLIYKMKNFEETILSERGYQPFTHVVGGGVTGSSGIHEGSFCYTIKRAAYYEEPMNFIDVQNHYNDDITSEFNITECNAACVDVIVMVTPSRTPTVTRTPSRTPTVTRTPSVTPTLTRTPSITPTPVGISTRYGLLYNVPAITDSRNIAAPGWHVPTYTEFINLVSYLDALGDSGGVAKEVGYTFWNSPNVGAINTSNFNGRGAGQRGESTGEFSQLLERGYFWTSTEYSPGSYYTFFLSYTTSLFITGIALITRGLSIRLVKDSTTLSNQQIGTYVGNDGQIYRTICLGGMEFLSSNLAETQYQNGDYITEVRDNSTWIGLTTGGCCAYENNWLYVSGVAPTPTPMPTITPSSPYWSTRYPSDLTFSILTGETGTTVSLTWINNGIQDYNEIVIERSSDSGSTYSEIDYTAPATTTYLDTSIIVYQTYYYRIRYRLGIQYSTYSNISIVTEENLWTSYWETLISATIEDTDPNDIVLTFLSSSSLMASDFTVTVNSIDRVISSSVWAGPVLTLNLAIDVIVGDAVIITFVKSEDTSNVTNNVGSAEMKLYITGLVTPLSSGQRALLDTFVKTVKSELSITNLSDAFDFLYVLAGETSESSLRNLVKNEHYATAVNSPTFTQYEGFSGGTTKYINTNYRPDTQSVQYTLNNSSIGAYCRTTTIGTYSVIGVSDASSRETYINPRMNYDTVGRFYCRINQTTYTFKIGSGDVKGMLIATRNANNSIDAYKNGTDLNCVGNTESSVAIPINLNMYLLAINGSGSATQNSPDQLSYAHAGRHLTNAEITALTNAFETYMDANGKGIIS